MTNRKKALLGASATIAVWATAFPFSKIALQSVDSLTLVCGKGYGWGLTYAGNRCCKRAYTYRQHGVSGDYIFC